MATAKKKWVEGWKVGREGRRRQTKGDGSEVPSFRRIVGPSVWMCI